MANGLFAIFLAHKYLFFLTTEVFICLKVINVFKQQNSWTDLFRKSSTPFTLILSKCHSQSIHGALDNVMLSVTLRFSSPVSTVSSRNAWGHESMIPLLWTKYEEKKEACRLTLTDTQARVSTFAVEIFLQKYLSIAKTAPKTVKTMPTKFPP